MASTRRRFLGLLAGLPSLPLALRAGGAWAQERVLAIHEATRNSLLDGVGSVLRRAFEQPDRAKAWPGLSRRPLPAPAREPALPLAQALESWRPTEGFGGESLGLDALSRLLHFTNGVTGRAGNVALRAAPSAGALYAGEVYVVAERVEDLPPGVYAYAPLEKKLVTLREGSAMDEVANALETPARARGAAAAVLLTNVFARYGWRYGDRGYRYAIIDSGHQGENLRLVSASAGLGCWGPLRFEDERLGELLGVDGVEEAVCAVHLLGARGTNAAPETSTASPGPSPARLVEAHRAGRALPPGADDPTERYHAATRLVRTEEDPSAAAASSGSGDGASASEATHTGDDETSRLPEPDAPALSVEEAIATRRSARRFAPGSVSGEALAFVLASADGHPALRRSPGLSLRLFAHRVAGLPAGLYAADASTRTLRALRRGDLSGELVDVCLRQAKAGEAAVAFAMVAELPRMAEAHGERVYRDLLLEAGSVGQRIYLAAEASGLAARNLAAFTDDSLNALTQVDGRRRAVVHLTLLGPGD